jgi:hypothetical protein
MRKSRGNIWKSREEEKYIIGSYTVYEAKDFE